MFIYAALYILSSFTLVCGATLIYNGNRHSPKHRAFGFLFIVMAFWQMSALLIILVPPALAARVFMYGLMPLLLASFMLLLHSVFIVTGVYTRRHAWLYRLLFLPPVINLALFPVDGWLYDSKLTVLYSDSPPLPGPGGFLNMGMMLLYLVVMATLLAPLVKRKHGPSRIWLIGMTAFILWAVGLALTGELSGTTHIFDLVPFGIDFWAFAVYYSVYKYDSLPSYEKRYKILFEKSPIGILITDADSVIREASPVAARYLGVPLQQLIGQSLYARMDEPERDELLRHYRDNFEQRKATQYHETSFQKRDGQFAFLSCSSDFIEMEGELYQLLMLKDITESKEREKQIHELAYFDLLTGLHNRVSFNLAFEEWRENRTGFALVLLDLNGFKQINDQYGHLAGDQALKHFAFQLKAAAEPSGFIARLSGDEFVALLPSAEDAIRTLSALETRLLTPFRLSSGSLLVLSASAGVAVYPGDGSDLDTVFKAADERMYIHKNGEANGTFASSTK